MNKHIISLITLCGSLAAPLPANATELALQDNPPERYIVVPGDTLWGISARFLKDPWRWPDLWGMNREQIKDPHWIYPGDVIVLDQSGKTPLLRVLKTEGATVTVKLNPRIRVEKIQQAAVPSIPAAAIEPFLSQPLIIDPDTLAGTPRIVAIPEKRVVIGAGDTAYAQGFPENAGEFWQVFRPGKTLVDPDTREVLGYEAIYLGEARLAKAGNPATVEIIKSSQEISAGDRFVPAPSAVYRSYAPHAPDKPVSGRIISAYSSLNVAEVGQNAIVTINKGNRDGLESGHVLAIYRSGETVAPQDKKEAPVKLPDERYGLAFVFRTFDKVAYALTMQTTRPVSMQDSVRNP